MPGIEELLGGGAPEQSNSNPLQEIQDAGSEIENASGGSDGTLDPEMLKEMMITGDNTDGMFEPNPDEILDEDEKAHEDVDKDAEVKTKGKVIEKGKKYVRLFAEELKHNPNEFYINTPKGQMSITQAISLGFNPETGEFDTEPTMKRFNDAMAELNEADSAGIKAMLNPNRANIAPADASKYGLDPSSPMVRQAMPQQMMPQEEAAMPPMPQAVPTQAAPTEAGAPQDILSILGGGNV